MKKKLVYPPELLAAFAEWGKLGGQRTAKRRTKTERRAAALKAIRARWQKYRADRQRQP